MSLLSYEPLEIVHENMKKGSIYSLFMVCPYATNSVPVYKKRSLTLQKEPLLLESGDYVPNLRRSKENY
jgi:hypothetical protein